MPTATSIRQCPFRWLTAFSLLLSPLGIISCNDAGNLDPVTQPALDNLLVEEATVMHVDSASGRKTYSGFCTHLTHGDEFRQFIALLLADDGTIHVFGLDGPGVPSDLPEYIEDMNLNGRIAGVYIRKVE